MEIVKIKKKKMAGKSARWGVDIGKNMAAKSARWLEIGKMKKKMAANSAGWGGDREDEEEDDGEECEVGWR